MAYELVLIFGILSIIIGIVPSIGFAIWRFGLKKDLWYSWLLGGLFWTLAMISRAIPLIILISLVSIPQHIILISTILAGIFETVFRVLLFLLFTKYTANNKEKVIMAGIGWGTIEAIFIHTIPLLFFLLSFRDSELMLHLDGIEYILLFGGFERLITELFHVVMMIFIFYGIKHKLKDIKVSKPIENKFYSVDPRPVWIWILIVTFLHFSYDFIFIVLWIWLGLLLSYLIMTGILFILIFYTVKRIRIYPLFPVVEGD